MKKINFILILMASIFILTQCKKDNPRSERCNLKPDPGLCKAYIPRYYFDKEDNKCKEFIWGGCEGVVPFETLEECKKKCGCE